MPRTKLHKDYSQNKQSDDVMADFQVPDDLRKQLEYPAQQEKRRLAVEHHEKKLAERLAAINTRLKEDKTKVSIQRVGDSLALQATLPLKPGEVSKDGSPNKQTKVSLGIPFNIDGLKTAEEEARELGKLIARKTFEWNEKYLRTKALKPEMVLTIGELLEQFEKEYFMTRKRNRQSEETFNGYVKNLERNLVLAEPLNKDTILNAISATKSGTGKRRELITSLSVFCNTFKFSFDFKGYKDGYEPRKRLLPPDNEIENSFHYFKPNKYKPNSQWDTWQWVYGMLAAYGLRPHEIFAIHVESFCDPKNTLHELRLDESITDGVKTGERTIFPLHPHWVELFDLKNVKMPNLNCNFESRTTLIGRSFKSAKINFSPYNLRHAYAIRGHELGIPLKEMSDNMGHSIEIHTKTYQKYMTMDSRRIVYQAAIDKADKTKAEQSRLEMLETENAMLKAENERLRALLIEHQLEGLLNR